MTIIMGKYKNNLSITFGIGSSVALGIAWVLDNGFWNIFVDTILGYIYVSYKLSQIFLQGYCI